MRKNSVLDINNHRSAAVRGARAGCAPPGSASGLYCYTRDDSKIYETEEGKSIRLGKLNNHLEDTNGGGPQKPMPKY